MQKNKIYEIKMQMIVVSVDYFETILRRGTTYKYQRSIFQNNLEFDLAF